MPGFIENGVLVGPETRSSSPVRIPRERESLSIIGLNNAYAAGEGSGYAGGIVSSASDGLRIAEII